MKNNPFEEARKSLEEGYNYSNTELNKNMGVIEAIKQLQEPKDISKVSEFSKDLAIKMVKWDILGSMLDIAEAPKINEKISNFSLSVGRKSRDEIIRLAVGLSGSKKKNLKERAQELVSPKEGGE